MEVSAGPFGRLFSSLGVPSLLADGDLDALEQIL
jgi:hypothetical protein